MELAWISIWLTDSMGVIDGPTPFQAINQNLFDSYYI